MKYIVTKTYGNDRGYSVAFRQWKAEGTHCKLLHGYSIGFEFRVGTDTLDERNWAFSFGDFKPIKQFLDEMFDHTHLVAVDDPLLSKFQDIDMAGGSRVIPLPKVGCEAIAEYVYHFASKAISDAGYPNNPVLLSVRVFEHGANTVTYNPTGL